MSRVRLVLVVASAAAVFLVCSGSAKAGLAPAVDYVVGGGPKAVAVADFNRDGRPDLVVANRWDDTVSVLLGTGGGAFSAATSFATGSGPGAVAAADFNADSKPDVAVAAAIDGVVSVLLGNGSGGFAAKVDYGVGTGPAAIVAADFSRDGRVDLAVANDEDGSVSVLLGNGSGGFGAKVDYGLGTGAAGLATGDFNADGKLDLAVCDSGDGALRLLLGNGSGGFSVGDEYYPAVAPAAVAVADLNGDGDADVVVGDAYSSGVSVLAGDGAGHLSESGVYGHSTVSAVAVRDLNGDAFQDIVVADGVSAVGVLIGDGAGQFRSGGGFPAGGDPVSLACGDLNADGKVDVVTANEGADTISVLLNDGTFLLPSIAVMPGQYDEIEHVLDAMGKSYDLIDSSALTLDGLADYRTLFMNCGTESCTAEAAAVVRSWVEAGGSLYASDWAYDYVDQAFPGRILFSSDPYIGVEGSVTSAILDPGLAWYLDPAAPPSTIDLAFDLGAWVVPTGVGAGTTTYLEGTVLTYEGAREHTPLLAGFTAGLGRAFYTAFHNHAQVSATEQKLLEYLVLMPEAGALANALRQAVLTAHPGWRTSFEGYVALDDDETSSWFQATPMAGQAMTIGANWAGARVRLEVYRPNGTLYATQETDNGPVIVDLSAATISANPGTWTYRLAGITVPDANHAAVVASFTPPDLIAPTTSQSGADSLWHASPVIVTLSGVDNAGGSGLAYTEYSRDGGETWVRGTSVKYGVWKRGGGSGQHTLQYRSVDTAGNVESPPKSVTVKIDARAPVTNNNAPVAPRTTDTTVTLTPTDTLSGVKETWYSLDGGTWTKGASVLVAAAGNVGRHWICYYSIDNAGNVEYRRWCSVVIAAGAAAARAPWLADLPRWRVSTVR